MFDHMKIRTLLGLIGVCFLGFITIVFVFVFAGLDQELISVSLSLLLYVVVPLIYFGHYYKKRPYSLGDVVFIRGLKQWIFPIIAIVAICIAFSLSTFWLALFAIEPVFPSLVDFLLDEVPYPTNSFYLFIEILTITILAPIVEEFFFRGVILHRLMKKSSMWGGILISSLLFGILHSDIIGAFFFGMIACLLYLRTGNLLLPILLHVLNNSLAVILGFVQIDWLESVLIMTREDITDKAIPIVIMLVISTILTLSICVKLGKGLTAKRNRMLAEVQNEKDVERIQL